MLTKAKRIMKYLASCAVGVILGAVLAGAIPGQQVTPMKSTPLKKAKALARAEIKPAEGLRLTRYRCPAGKQTVGYGHRIKPGESFPNGISKQKAESLLTTDISIAVLAVQTQYREHLDSLNAARMSVLIEMAFCLGSDGLGAFHEMFRAIERENWRAAGAEIQNSDWYWIQGKKEKNCGIVKRVERLKRQMLSGEVE